MRSERSFFIFARLIIMPMTIPIAMALHILFIGMAINLANIHLADAADLTRTPSATKNFEFIATVNGIPIAKGLFELNVQAAIAQGQKDTPQLREAIQNELIHRQLIAQEVLTQGLDKEIDLENQITQLRQNLYLQAFIDDYLKKNPITADRLQAEYNKQRQSLGNRADSTTQYSISQIVLKSESEAIAVINRLQAGDPFSKVAKALSVDAATKSQGGALGWVNPQQLGPQMSDTLRTLGKGGFSKSPMKIGDVWVIIRVDDIRSAKILSFEASQNQLKQAIIQQHLSETLMRLRESSRIVQ